MSKYLDSTGLAHLWSKITAEDLKSAVKLFYNEETRQIELKDGTGNTIEGSGISAAPFLKDGMLDDITIVTSSIESPVTYGEDAEGNPKTYTDGTKFIAFYWNVEAGDTDPDTEGVQVKVDYLKVDEIGKIYTAADKGGIAIADDNSISISDAPASEVITSKIVIAGGPLADYAKQVYGNEIPEGTSVNELFTKLFCVEKFPDPAATSSYGSLTSTISKPTMASMPSQDGKCVKIGTEVTLGEVKAANAVANTPKLTFDNFSYGFATTEGKYEVATSETNPAAVNATVTTNNVTYTLSKEYSGFGKSAIDNTSTTGADASTLSFASETVNVALGENKMTYTLSVSGQVHSATVQAPAVYYPLTNLGNTSLDGVNKKIDKTALYTYTPNPATPASKSNTDVNIYGVYPVYHNSGAGTGNLSDNTVEVVGTSKDQTTFEVSYKDDATNQCSFSYPSDRTLTVQIWNSTFNKWEAPAASNQKTQTSSIVINNVTYNQWIYTGNALGTGAKFTFTLSKKISE